MLKTRSMRLLVLAALVIVGCGKKPEPVDKEGADAKKEAGGGGGWTLEKVTDVASGLKTPECMVYDAASGKVYVSNIDTDDKGYWDDDGKGFISILNADGSIDQLKWLDSKTDQPINGPKGMCILGGKLYFADNTRLKRCDLGTGANPEQVKLPGEKLNDLASDGDSVWVSDTGASKLFKVDPAGGFVEVKSPEAVNGVTCKDGKVYAVSWDLHEIYEIDPTGEKDPVPFGLADNFTTLDGIDVLPDG